MKNKFPFYFLNKVDSNFYLLYFIYIELNLEKT